VIALDRMERGQGERSAVQEVQQDLQLPVTSIATLDDLTRYLEARGEMARELQWVMGYRLQYGVKKDAG
jgi:orotate phosphoribosyltransferase